MIIKKWLTTEDALTVFCFFCFPTVVLYYLCLQPFLYLFEITVRGKLDEYHYLVHKRHITVTNITRRISGLEGQKRFFPPTKCIYLPDSLPSKWGGRGSGACNWGSLLVLYILAHCYLIELSMEIDNGSLMASLGCSCTSDNHAPPRWLTMAYMTCIKMDTL